MNDMGTARPAMTAWADAESYGGPARRPPG